MCSVATRRKLFRGIMRTWNPFILFSSVNGSIALKFAIISRHTGRFSNIWKLFTTRNEFTVIATLCHQMNSSKYIKEHTLRRSCWQVEFGRNFSFQLVLNFDIGPKLLYFRQRGKRLENAKKRGFQPEKSGGSPAVADSAAVYWLDIYGKNVCRILSPKA